MTRVLDAIKTVVPEFDETTFDMDMQMLQIPGWDSMNSVNLLMQLQKVFEVPFDQFVLVDETRVSDIAAFLKANKVSVSKV